MYATLSLAAPVAGDSLRVLHLKRPAFGASWHHHETFELNVILRGQGTRWVAGGNEVWKAGDIVLVPPDMPHSWASADGENTAPSEAIVVFFSASLLGDPSQWPELRRARRLLEEVGTGLVFETSGPEILAALKRLPRLTGAARLLAFLDCLERLARARRRALTGSVASAQGDDRARALLRRALFHLARVDRPPPQAEMAHTLGLSAASFSRLFKRSAGLTYTDFIDARRIERSCALLQNGELGIAQIAFASGFDNLSNFNRRFRLALGETPSAYRRRFEQAMAAPSEARPAPARQGEPER